MFTKFAIFVLLLILESAIVISAGVVISRSSDNKVVTEREIAEGFGLRLKLSSEDIDPDIIEDSFLKTPQLIEKYGHKAETHFVTTEDGYILEMHRIPKPGGIPVLLMHGLLDSSSTWVIMGPKKGFAYILADLGYDVWMGNVRGNTYSKNHTTLSPAGAKYWKFTFHEMGKYDVPAMIDHIIDVTKVKQIHYIGHSQGTIIFWIMCSENPEYNDKVMLMQALAPVAFLGDCKSLAVNFLSLFRTPVGIILRLIGANEFLPSSDFLGLFSQIMCKDKSFTQAICSNAIFIFTGYDKEEMNRTMLPVVFGHTPAGASTKQLLHFGQLKDSRKFRQYDYGMLENFWRYGRSSPPNYDLSQVKVKVALHYSRNDWLAESADVEKLHQHLPNAIGKFLVKNDKFNHLDFVWAIHAKDLLYDRVLKIMSLTERGEL